MDDFKKLIMNILIICTYFPPDTAIAAVRPYMFAKYLDKMGDKVTVICSGRINSSVGWFCDIPESIRVIVCNKNKYSPQIISSRSRIFFLPSTIRHIIADVYHFLTAPIVRLFLWRKTRNYEKQFSNEILKLDRDSFDIVFSTYGEAENIKSAVVAKKYFNCPLVIDLRDPIIRKIPSSPLGNFILRKYEKLALAEASAITTVSYGVSSSIKNKTNCKVSTIYNGFEPEPHHSLPNNIFTICYTGQIYQAYIPVLHILCRLLSELISENSIPESQIRFEYCGPSSDSAKEVFYEHSLSNILNDHGYMNKAETKAIQNKSDIFLVLSWNTNSEKGILSGKFCEGIGLKKNIVAFVSGDELDSELFLLNKQYHYGYCYEEARKGEQNLEFKNYLFDLYCKKNKGVLITSDSDEVLYEKFSYPNLTAELRGIFESLV